MPRVDPGLALTAKNCSSAVPDAALADPVDPPVDLGGVLPLPAAAPTTAPLPAPVPQTTPRRSWYGWQIILADLATVGCLAATGSEGCLAGYALGAPVIHGANGNLGRAGLSLALRVVLPVVGAGIGAAAANCSEPLPRMTTMLDGGTITTWSLCGLSEIGLGLMVGAAAAIVVDGFVAFLQAPAAVDPETAKPAARISIVPRVAVGQNNVAMGVSATF